MAKMGRPKVENPADKRITIRLNGEEHELLLEYTKNHNMTMTQVVKMAVFEKGEKMACRKDLPLYLSGNGAPNEALIYI